MGSAPHGRGNLRYAPRASASPPRWASVGAALAGTLIALAAFGPRSSPAPGPPLEPIALAPSPDALPAQPSAPGVTAESADDPLRVAVDPVLAPAETRPLTVVDARDDPVPHADLILDDGAERRAVQADGAGEHRLEARFRGRVVAYDAALGGADVEVTPGPTPLRLQLVRGVDLTVSVRGPSGAPGAGARVWWRPLGVPRACGRPPASATNTDAAGVAHLAPPSRSGEVCAEDPAGLRACRPVVDDRLTLTPAAATCVEIVAVAGAERRALSGWARVASGASYARGLALPGVLDDVPVDDVLDVEVDVPGYALVRARRSPTRRLEIPLAPPARLRFVAGGPQEAFPALLLLEGPERREVAVAAPGPVEAEALAPGHYDLTLSGPGGAARTRTFDLGPGQALDLGALPLDGGGGVEVRGRGWVSLRVEATGALASVADLGDGGAWQVTALPSGWLTVLRRTERGWAPASRVWISPGPLAVVDLDEP